MEDLQKTVVVRRADGVDREMEAVTPAAAPNILVQTMSATYAVFIRSLRVFAQSFMGIMSAQGVGAVDAILGASVTPDGLWNKIVVAFWLAMAPAAFTAIQNTAELIMRLDEKLPKLRG